MYAVMERIQKRSTQRAAGWVGIAATGARASVRSESIVFRKIKEGSYRAFNGSKGAQKRTASDKYPYYCLDCCRKQGCDVALCHHSLNLRRGGMDVAATVKFFARGIRSTGLFCEFYK
jgi:hypothetical protein